MLLELTLNNYRLFKQTSTISFSADLRTKWLLSNSVCLDNRNVLKSIGLYGENNGGKTKLVELFKILKDIMTGTVKGAINRKLFMDSSLSTFSIEFNNEDELGWLRYEFSFDSENNTLPFERLSSVRYYNNGSPFEKTIFEKNIANRVLNIFGQDESRYLDVLPCTRPFLYTVKTDEGKFAPLSVFVTSFQMFAASIVVVDLYNIPIRHTLEALKSDDKEEKEFIRSFVRSADLSIEDFFYDKKISILDGSEEGEIPEIALNNIVEIQDAFRLATTYNGVKVPSLAYDSAGTKKIEAIASYIYDSIVKGKLLVVDELDNGLHFNLTRAIVSAFNNLANEKGQLLFTSHDLLLIACKNLLRKDQVCFIERNADGAMIYCLKQATVSNGGPREGSDLLDHYQRGDFGRVPMPSFVKNLLDIQKKGNAGV